MVIAFFETSTLRFTEIVNAYVASYVLASGCLSAILCLGRNAESSVFAALAVIDVVCSGRQIAGWSGSGLAGKQLRLALVQFLSHVQIAQISTYIFYHFS
nr:MAG TPA: hypothetical protein [Caudoviricetes sp.]